MLVLALVSQALAGSLAGVTLPDEATVGGQGLVLNGLGLREKFMFDIYVGALYLPAKTTSASKAISDDVPKRIVMHFVYSAVPAAKVNETFDAGFARQPGIADLQSRVDQLKGWMADLTTGDEVVFDYVPGAGTKVTVKGTVQGTIEGADFMQGLFGVYLGPAPPTAALKAGMLGG